MLISYRKKLRVVKRCGIGSHNRYRTSKKSERMEMFQKFLAAATLKGKDVSSLPNRLFITFKVGRKT